MAVEELDAVADGGRQTHARKHRTKGLKVHLQVESLDFCRLSDDHSSSGIAAQPIYMDLYMLST